MASAFRVHLTAWMRPSSASCRTTPAGYPPLCASLSNSTTLQATKSADHPDIVGDLVAREQACRAHQHDMIGAGRGRVARQLERLRDARVRRDHADRQRSVSGRDHRLEDLPPLGGRERPALTHQTITEDARQTEHVAKMTDVPRDAGEVEALIGEERCWHGRPDALGPALLLAVARRLLHRDALHDQVLRPLTVPAAGHARASRSRSARPSRCAAPSPRRRRGRRSAATAAIRTG